MLYSTLHRIIQYDLTNIVSNISIKWYYSILSLLGLFHLVTLSFSPIPWFDEVFFADITKSYIETGRLELRMAPYAFQEKEVLTYGPVYFWLTSLTSYIFGFNPFSIRLVNLVACWFSIFIFFKLITVHYNVSKKIGLFFSLLILLDPIVHSSSHSGRMDFLALSFAITSLYFLLQQKDSEKVQWLSTSISGIAAGIAILTTPRIAVIIVPLGLIMILRWALQKKINRLYEGLLWGGLIIAIYSPWFIIKFGNIQSLISYYSTLSHFVAGGGKIPYTFWPIILITISVLMFNLKLRTLVFLIKNELAIVSLVIIILFHLLVTLTSAHYLGIIMPYYLMLIIFLIVNNTSYLIKNVIFLLLPIFIAFFSLKAIFLFSDLSKRDPKAVTTFLKKNIPPGASIAGDYKYFYQIKKSNYKFIDYQYSVFTSEIAIADYINKNVSYLLLPRQGYESSAILENLLKNKGWEIKDHLEYKNNNSILNKILPSSLSTSYNGILFIKNQSQFK